MPIFDDPETFYSRDYSDPREDDLRYDPLAGPSELQQGRTKRFNEFGEFIEDGNETARIFAASKYAPSQGGITKAQAELVPVVEAEHPDDYAWWRKEKSYLEWLDSQGLDPNSIDNYSGNKLFTEYIQYRAQNPQGFMRFSSDVAAAIGGVVRGVSDVLAKVPGVKHVAKPVGSIMQFIGNLFDLPRNVLAGAFTAISTGKPEEILGNVVEAFNFSIGNITGNEEGGKYFSWMDGQLMNMVEKAKQGMSDQEYKAYIDSDSFRQTKRLWQTGGMLLDMVLDPAWFTGAAAAKSYKAAKTFKAVQPFIDSIKDNIGKIFNVADPMKAAERVSGLSSALGDIKVFSEKSKKMLGFIREDKSFLEKLGMSAWDFEKEGILNSVHEVVRKFDAMGKGELKSFETALRLKIPGTSGIRLSPSLEPLLSIIEGKIGGKVRGFLNVTSRQAERAAEKVKIFTNANETIIRGGKAIGESIDEIAAGKFDFPKDVIGKDEIIRAAQELKKSPDMYKDFISAILEKEEGAGSVKFLNTPIDMVARDLFEVHKPLFDTIMQQPAIHKLREDYKKLMGNTRTNLERHVKESFRLARVLGITDDAALYFGREVQSLDDLFFKAGKRGRKEVGGRIKDEVSVLEFAAKDIEMRLGKEGLAEASKLRQKAAELKGMYTRYYYRLLTPEAKAFFEDLAQKTKKAFQDEPLGIGQLAPDHYRRIYIPVDMKNEWLQKYLFNGDARARFKQLLATDEKAAFLEMNTAIRELSHKDPDAFLKLTKFSDQFNAKGIPLMLDDVALDTSKNIRPLISEASTSLMNHLSQKGLVVKGFTGRLYEGGFEPVYRKMIRDQQMIEKLDAMNDIAMEGQKGGWLKKVTEPTALEPGWKEIDQGIFRGFAVRDYLEAPMNAAMKGAYEIAEAAAPGPWVLETAKNALAGFNRWWKVNIYLKNPAAHTRNFIANRMIMQGDGVSFWNMFSKEAKMGRKVWEYYRTAEKYQEAIFKNMDLSALKGKMNQLGSEFVELGGKRIQIREATEILMKENVLSSGFTSTVLDEVRKVAQGDGDYAKFGRMQEEANRSFAKKLNPFGINDFWAQEMRKAGQWVENAYGRLEHFFTLTNRKGMSIREAADQTNKVLIDYGRISRTEGAIRKYLIPFYTWQSRMIPIMFEKAVTQPVYFTKFTQFKNNMYKILELDRNFAPMGEETMEGIPMVDIEPGNIAKFIKGKPLNEIRTSYISSEGWLPQAVVNLFKPGNLKNLLHPEKPEDWLPLELMKNIGEGGFDYAMQGLTPLMKLPVESVSGYSFQFKRPLQAYPTQTVSFLGKEMKPQIANLLRSVFGALRQVDDFVNVFEKNAITGQPKYTGWDILWKNLLGYRPYNRDEIREVNGALGELRDFYMGNLSDARKKVFDKKAQSKHALAAIQAMHGIKALEWYKEFVTEVRDKERTIRGIEEDIETLQERLRNPKLNRKQRAKYAEEEMDLQSRLAAFIADQEEF